VSCGGGGLGASGAFGALLEVVDEVADEVLLIGVEFQTDAQRQRPGCLATRRHKVHLNRIAYSSTT